MFAFNPYLSAHPPDCRMIEQDGFGRDQHDVCQGIEPTDVSQFMHYQRIQLLRQKSANRRNRD